jgi:hypothetical protein
MASKKPTRKVSVGLAAGAVSLIVVALLKEVGGIALSAEAGMALTTLATFVLQYIVPDAASDE